MRAVVVYESMFGNTHRIADAIGAGLSPAFDVSVLPVAQAGAEVLAGADLVVVGGPTHAHGMSRPVTRQAATQEAGKPGSGLTAEPGAAGPGLREWFRAMGHCDTQAAAFDTRMHGPAVLTGRASKGAAQLLREHGFHVMTGPESFLVSRQHELDPAEPSRAREWGASLARARAGAS